MNRKKRQFNGNIIPALPNPYFEPLIEMISNRLINIDGCEGIVEYNDTLVCANCKAFTLNVKGFDLCIKAETKNSLSISGRITEISFS